MVEGIDLPPVKNLQKRCYEAEFYTIIRKSLQVLEKIIKKDFDKKFAK